MSIVDMTAVIRTADRNAAILRVGHLITGETRRGNIRPEIARIAHAINDRWDGELRAVVVLAVAESLVDNHAHPQWVHLIRRGSLSGLDIVRDEIAYATAALVDTPELGRR